MLVKWYLLNKGLIQVVWSPNTQVHHIHASSHSVIEGIQKPRGVGHLHSAGQGSSTPLSVCPPCIVKTSCWADQYSITLQLPCVLVIMLKLTHLECVDGLTQHVQALH